MRLMISRFTSLVRLIGNHSFDILAAFTSTKKRGKPELIQSNDWVLCFGALLKSSSRFTMICCWWGPDWQHYYCLRLLVNSKDRFLTWRMKLPCLMVKATSATK